MGVMDAGTKKLRSDSPGLVDIVVRLVTSLTRRASKSFRGNFFFQINKQEHSKTSKIFGLVKMSSGLVHLGYSLPEGQAGKLKFFVL